MIKQLDNKHTLEGRSTFRVKPVLSLSSREAQCLRMFVKGLSARAIGEELDLSRRTVESYLESVKSKLGCFNKTELIIAAIKHQYIDINAF